MTDTGKTPTQALVLYAAHGGVALLTLNRPNALNAFARERYHAL